MSSLLLEGGLYGHLNHLYDNPDLSFGEIKKIFDTASSGELQGTEKTDGQNLFISYSVKDGKAKAARNKGNIKTGGMDAMQLASKFADRGALEKAFVDSFDAFEKVIEAGVDIVILACPPKFRAKHFEAAVKARKHVF